MRQSPILCDITTQLHTERLTIRCPQPGDGAAVYAGVVESLDALRQFPASLPWAMAEPSVDESEKFCHEGQANYLRRTAMPMLVFLKASNIFVASSGLHALNWSVPKCEIGYWIRSSYAHQGFATEAVKAITQFAVEQLGMRRVEALPDDENQASGRVCERAGYRLEGLLHNERADTNGNLRNTRMYAYVQ
jgi:RimJ/RimL family protein N-acetyltransferase